MSGQYPDLFAALFAQFAPGQIRTRTQAGRQLQYITARTAMNRLDDVLGSEGWWDEYTMGENSVLCKLTIRLPDGSTLTKVDAGGYAGMLDQSDDEKSGVSDAFKRAAVKFGVGRYLYRDGIPNFVRDRQSVPDVAAVAVAPSTRSAPTPSHPPVSDNSPRSGRAFFVWIKDQEQRHEVGLLKYIAAWSKIQEFPGRIVDWDADQVFQAHAECVRKLQAIGSVPTDRESDDEHYGV